MRYLPWMSRALLMLFCLSIPTFAKSALKKKLTIDIGAHDRDNNRKLDGIELLTALEHDRKHEAEEHDGEEASTEDLESEVEAIFSEHDKDGDGYLDYKEFLGVHKTHPDISGERKGNKKHKEL